MNFTTNFFLPILATVEKQNKNAVLHLHGSLFRPTRLNAKISFLYLFRAVLVLGFEMNMAWLILIVEPEYLWAYDILESN